MSKSRDFPVFYESAHTDQYTIQFEIPDGYVLESAPEPLNIALPERALSYSYKVMSQDSKLLIQIVEARRKDIFSPEMYEGLREVYDQIMSKQSEKIILVKA